MRILSGVLAIATSLALLPAAARADDGAGLEAFVAQTLQAQPVQPDSPVPTAVPPSPPAAAPGGAAGQATPPGQWVYTGQYGWVWMPYGNSYVQVPGDGSAPNMYVYWPSVGWSWVIAPWIWGWGSMPYFGLYGPARFGWWGHGFGHWYGFRGAYADWYGCGYFRGGLWHYPARGMLAGGSYGGYHGPMHGGGFLGGWAGHGPSRHRWPR